jgi:hypothetical protein
MQPGNLLHGATPVPGPIGRDVATECATERIGSITRLSLERHRSNLRLISCRCKLHSIEVSLIPSGLVFSMSVDISG